MLYNDYHFVGMHLIWWFVWIIFLFWIFAMPYNIPGQRFKRESPLELLKRRFASGQINEQEYKQKKSILDQQ